MVAVEVTYLLTYVVVVVVVVVDLDTLHHYSSKSLCINLLFYLFSPLRFKNSSNTRASKTYLQSFFAMLTLWLTVFQKQKPNIQCVVFRS